MASCMSSSSSRLRKGLFRVLLLAVVALSTTCLAQDPAIVGGRAASPGAYPFFVQGDGCGGSLILTDVVLTAAHCVASPGEEPAFEIGGSVIVGNTQFDKVTAGAQQREVISAMQVHPLWDGNALHGYDFALFQIKGVTKPELVPVPLNYDSCNPSDGEKLTVVGFGVTATDAPSSDVLLEVDLTYVPNNVCQEANRRATPTDPELRTVVISDNMMCAGYPVGEPIAASCSGDSGGPLLDGGVQVGVVSWSVKPCGQYPGVPDAFSRVSDEYDWIRETACELTSTNAELCKSNKSVKSKKCKKSKKGVMKSMNGMMNSMNGMMKSMKGRK